ncbi:hypothetical protein [Speluncibacter jeojiensis]|uniref:Uncharacterized protein n=1 Tax=Speluncibacter jeojiensis TaxID=2710754 RepID=A0A9X4LWG5_9ACTN|nr:hypothetical protein [Corynebacteriales bacterium D3-21]
MTIEITGRYGTELRPLADTVRATAVDALTTMLGGEGVRACDAIDVTITDVTTDDHWRAG